MTTTTQALTEDQIRADERAKWAERLRENVGTFADFASDKRAAVLLVALAMELPLGGDGA